LEPIAAHFGVSRSDVMMAGLHPMDFVGRDAVLGFADRTERLRPTPLFESLKRDALRIRPRLIVIDTVADAFAGKENDRAQTRQFINLLPGMGAESGAAIIIASHPSLTGIASDTGLSGSTAWHNSVRARAYFKSLTEDNDDGLRVLEFRKNNY